MTQFSLEEFKRIAENRTKGEAGWKYKTYSPVTDEYDEQFYDWFIETECNGHPELRICSHENTNHRNGKFIAYCGTHADAIIEVMKLAKERLGPAGWKILERYRDCKARIEKLETALRFYARPEWLSSGETARKALEET